MDKETAESYFEANQNPQPLDLPKMSNIQDDAYQNLVSKNLNPLINPTYVSTEVPEMEDVAIQAGYYPELAEIGTQATPITADILEYQYIGEPVTIGTQYEQPERTAIGIQTDSPTTIPDVQFGSPMRGPPPPIGGPIPIPLDLPGVAEDITAPYINEEQILDAVAGPAEQKESELDRELRELLGVEGQEPEDPFSEEFYGGLDEGNISPGAMEAEPGSPQRASPSLIGDFPGEEPASRRIRRRRPARSKSQEPTSPRKSSASAPKPVRSKSVPASKERQRAVAEEETERAKAS